MLVKRYATCSVYFKNLLSVSKFAHENDVFFEFHPPVCFVKEVKTKEILLQEIIKQGLYAFDLFLASKFHKTSHGLKLSSIFQKPFTVNSASLSLTNTCINIGTIVSNNNSNTLSCKKKCCFTSVAHEVGPSLL